MANYGGSGGFFHVANRGIYTPILEEVYIPTSDSNKLCAGDPIIFNGTGVAATGIPTAILATAGATNPVSGFLVSPSTRGITYNRAITRTASIGEYWMADTNPNAVFRGKVNAIAAVTTLKSNMDLVYVTPDSTDYSGWMAAVSTSGTGATKQLRFLGYDFTNESDFTAAYAWGLFQVNLHSELLNQVGL